MSNNELKPCPFCGGKAQLVEQSIQDPLGRPRVDCTVCRGGFDFIDNKKTLTRLWNTRQSPWISVSDRLPEDDVPVLVYFNDDIDAEIDYCTTDLHYGNTWFANDPDRAVSHWKPIPDMPRKNQ